MNVKEILRDNKTYVFVTRGRAKEISDEEIEEFFGESSEGSSQFIPNERGRVTLFLKDLRMGLEFCSSKYGVTVENVISEAHRIAPHLNVKK